MTAIAGPNWLAVTGTIFALIGFGVLALGLASGLRFAGQNTRVEAGRSAASSVIIAAGAIAGGLGLAMQFLSQLGAGTGDAATPLAALGLIPLLLGAALGADNASARAVDGAAFLDTEAADPMPQSPSARPAMTTGSAFRPIAATQIDGQLGRLHTLAAE